MRQYGLYQNGKLVATGTRKQIAWKMGMTEGQLRACGYQKGGDMFLAIMDKEIDCFAYTGRAGEPCIALTVAYCDWEKCNFYKPKTERK